MTTLDKFIGRMNLFFAFFSFGWLIYALTETDFNMYKVAFWLLVGTLNMFNYIAYKWNGN
jgi:hypothetical protein